MKDYYHILNLNRKATPEEIKKSYRLYASKFHPDKHHGDKLFEEKFKEVLEAYEILSNPKKREEYDGRFDLKKDKYKTYDFDSPKRENPNYYENSKTESQTNTTNSKTSQSTKTVQDNETPVKNFGK